MQPVNAFDNNDLRAIREAGETVRNSGVESRIENRHYDDALTAARDLLQSLQEKDTTLRTMEEQRRNKDRPAFHTLLFASQSLGEQGLLEAMESVSGDEEAVIVLRGVPEDMNLADGLLFVQRLTKNISPTPNIIVDPGLFKKHNITSVPTIVVLESEPRSGEQLARVSGITSTDWLRRELAEGRKGDLGIQGPVREIAEPDFIEVAQRKIMETDWEAKKEEAITRFWEKQTFYELPKARHPRTRTINPEVMVTDNITTPDGQVVAFKGQRINPLEKRSFTQALIIFDPMDEAQLDLIAKIGPELLKRPGVLRLTYIATNFDKKRGWESYEATAERLDSPVYLLTPEIRSRFELEFVPAVVTATNKQFVVEELLTENGD